MTYCHLPWRLLMLDFLQFYPQKLVMWLENLFPGHQASGQAPRTLQIQGSTDVALLSGPDTQTGPALVPPSWSQFPRGPSSSGEPNRGWIQKPWQTAPQTLEVSHHTWHKKHPHQTPGRYTFPQCVVRGSHPAHQSFAHRSKLGFQRLDLGPPCS